MCTVSIKYEYVYGMNQKHKNKRQGYMTMSPQISITVCSSLKHPV
mgnify:CR=1 FL=1